MSKTSPAVVITPRGRFAIQRGESLLAALERTGHTVEYQCRSGYCGACRLRLSDPQMAEQLHYPIEPLAHRAAGELLPCCCQVKGEIALQLVEAVTKTDSPS